MIIEFALSKYDFRDMKTWDLSNCHLVGSVVWSELDTCYISSIFEGVIKHGKDRSIKGYLEKRLP